MYLLHQLEAAAFEKEEWLVVTGTLAARFTRLRSTCRPAKCSLGL